VTRFEGQAHGLASDPEAVRRVAPWLSKDRAVHWADVIAADVDAGRYTPARMLEVSALICAEKEGEES
jgi:hypothetical protein